MSKSAIDVDVYDPAEHFGFLPPLCLSAHFKKTKARVSNTNCVTAGIRVCTTNESQPSRLAQS